LFQNYLPINFAFLIVKLTIMEVKYIKFEMIIVIVFIQFYLNV